MIKEGKERNQGVGYLDDGTMVVVENGRRLIGQRLEVTATSVIQTNAGKMIFLAILSPAQFEGPALIDVHLEEPWRTLHAPMTFADPA